MDVRGMLMDQCSLVVSSCDKYETAWYPYFELIKKYWRDRPKNIYLITETKTYSHEGLEILCINSGSKCTWSERLYQCLSLIKTKYIIFSLEDFFLLGEVNSSRLEKCFEWMEDNPNIAVCRLAASNDKRLKPTEKYDDFYIASNDIGHRLDTQFAIWNREVLISFLDLSESPWEFEGNGSRRIKDTSKIFLWHYVEDEHDIRSMIIPYLNQLVDGYNIHWGKWFWNNKEWFEKNGIHNVNYKKLGTLSEKNMKRRLKYLYNRNPDRLGRVIKMIYQLIDIIERLSQNIRVFGWKAGLKENDRILKKHLKMFLVSHRKFRKD
jgi:hypothetical protein